MISIPSLRFQLPRALRSAPSRPIKIEQLEAHDIEAATDKRGRALKHIIKLNHANHAILYNELRFHNHMPHILASAYLLGADAVRLQNIYDLEATELEKWTISPGEVTAHDWRDFLGDGRYQRAYVDFFEDEVVESGYEWREVVDQYLYSEPEPLFNSLSSGLGHPLIHLGYAFELSSREVAMEALGLAATCYDPMHKYLDQPAFSKPDPNGSSDLLSILEKIANDKRLDNVSSHVGGNYLPKLFEDHETLLMEYWNSWQFEDPTTEFRQSQTVGAALLAGTQTANDHNYDFFLVHILTTSHAVRTLLPIVPPHYQIPLVRQWWLLTLAIYISQLRPAVDTRSILSYDTAGKSWRSVVDEANEGPWSNDAHFVKAIRTLKEAARTWGDDDSFYLKAAVKLCDEFSGWTGFGA